MPALAEDMESFSETTCLCQFLPLGPYRSRDGVGTPHCERRHESVCGCGGGACLGRSPLGSVGTQPTWEHF